MGDFKKLKVWTRSIDLAAVLHQATRSFPRDERFSLTVQLHRAAVSVASNIAEGEGRGGDRESARFFRIARGSLHEVECQLHVAHRLKYLSDQQFDQLNQEATEISRMLLALIRHRSKA